MRNFFTHAAVATALLALVGCAANIDGSVVEPEAVEAEDVASTDDALVSNSNLSKRLVGEYKSATAYPTFRLNSNKTYELDTGLRCVTAPCPSGETGKWFLTGNPNRTRQVVLRPRSGGVKTLDVTKASTPATLVGVSGIRGKFKQVVEVASCAATLCRTGTTCVDGPNGAECIPVTTCAATLCAANTRCLDTPTGAECVPLDLCARMRCAFGCADGACLPAATCASTTCEFGSDCRDTATGAECIHRCATVRCASGTTCSIGSDGTARCN